MRAEDVLGAAKKYTDKAIAASGTGSGAKIDDGNVGTSTVWSSTKTTQELEKKVTNKEYNEHNKELDSAILQNTEDIENLKNEKADVKSVTELNSNLVEQKMLGWTVPSECPIQNEVIGNQFIQKVGRTKFDDVTILDIINNNTILRIYNIDGIKKEWKPTIYLDGYISENPKDYAGWNNANDKTIGSLSTYEYILIKDISCGSIDAFKTKNNGKYIYYELETPITINIDGNEVTERINESLGVIGKCKNLLNPTLQTTTINGVTCTNNGDGTFTFNGTATANLTLEILTWSFITPGIYRFVGCPSGGSTDKYTIETNTPPTTGDNNFKYDIGNGVDLTVSPVASGSDNNIVIRIIIKSGCVCNNLVFKPMLTTNTGVTYNDFVPYTGDGETLTHDVAELKNDFGTLKKITSQPLTTYANYSVFDVYQAGKLVMITFYITMNQSLSEWTKIDTLPSAIQQVGLICNAISSDKTPLRIKINKNGNLEILDGQIGGEYEGSLVYLVS